MSLQDDIFDIEEALKRKPNEKEKFHQLMLWLGQLEVERDILQEQVYSLKRAIKIVKEVE